MSRRNLTIDPLVITEAESRGNLAAGLFSACIIYLVLGAAVAAGWWIVAATLPW